MTAPITLAAANARLVIHCPEALMRHKTIRYSSTAVDINYTKIERLWLRTQSSQRQ